MKSSLRSIQISVSEASHLDESLTRAVDVLINNAVANNCGILVIRHSHEQYTAEVSPNVPFGLTREKEGDLRTTTPGLKGFSQSLSS